MPTTYNGIGTTYYGKKNLHKERGICQHCRADTEISSYETRLWFVILFIPVIPLGKKQIIDYCPVCTRHRAVPLGHFKEVSDQAVTEVSRKAGERPTDPKAAIERHATLAAFQRHEEARQYADEMAAGFPGDADVQFYLGVWHAEAGRLEQADPYLNRALELAPDNRAAARAVAIRAIQQGDLARARDLLSFMQTPGPDQDPGVLVLLADAYQGTGDHESALGWYRIAMEGSPGLAGDKKLRKKVRASEAALGRQQSVLGEVPGSGRRRLMWGVAAAAIVAVPLLVNYYMASHQTLYLVNRLPEQVTVTIDGQGDGIVLGKNVENIPISEGKHQAVIVTESGQESTVDFEIQNEILQRFFRDSVFVLNPGGAADLLWQEVVYSVKPDPNADIPHRIHFGEEFLVFRAVDYPFQEPPAQIRIKGKPVTKTRVDVLDLPPMAVMLSFLKNAPPDELLGFAEHHLEVNPADEMLIKIYWVICRGTGQVDRCRAFLEKGISRKPVLIEWHRTYQETARSAAQQKSMVAHYDRLLAEDPKNAALLYLRGRLAPRVDESQTYFDRAIAADPENPYAYFAKGYQLLSNGEFAQAKAMAAKAHELKPDHEDIARILFESRLALGEYEALEQELRKSLEENALDVTAQENLLRVLVASGRVEDAEDAHAAFARQAAATAREGVPAQLAVQSQRNLQYFTGDLEGWLKSARQLDGAQSNALATALALIETGNLDEADKGYEKNSPLESGYFALLFAIAWKEKGDEAKAEEWQKRAVESFASGTQEQALIADLLRKGDALELDDVNQLVAARPLKAALLVGLAETCPSKRNDLLKQAEKLNLLGPFPYHLLRRAIEARKG